MEGSPSEPDLDSTTASAAEQLDLEEVGNGLLADFERHDFFRENCKQVRSFRSEFREYISIDILSSKFPEVRNSNFRRSTTALGTRRKEEEMERRVLCYLLGRAFTGSTLKILISDPRWMEPLCSGLILNSLVVNLHIHFELSFLRAKIQAHTFQGLLEKSVHHFSHFLEYGPPLRGLHFSSSVPLNEYGKYITQALRANKLHELSFTSSVDCYEDSSLINSCSKQIAEALVENTSIKVLKVDGFLDIVDSFVWQDSTTLESNQAVKDLTLVFNWIGAIPRSGLSSLEEVVSSNQRLVRIRLVNAGLSTDRWLGIIGSLRRNRKLQVFDIGSSKGWMSRTVLHGLLEVARSCTQIIDLGLDKSNDIPRYDVLEEGSDLFEEPRKYVPVIAEQLRLNKEYGQVLGNAPRGLPLCARVILCGPGYAGKTTLCNTMLGIRRSSLERHMLLQRHPSLWRILYGRDAEKELDERTRGVDMHVLEGPADLDLKITLWDFAGQKEYYALHDYMFPNVNSANLFLFTFSLVASPFDSGDKRGSIFARIEGIERELLFWLRFLCSNSKEIVDPKPRVLVVFTNLDRVTESKRWGFKLDEIFEKLRRRFESRLDLVATPIVLNAHSEDMVRAVKIRIFQEFKDMRPKLESTFTICEEVRVALGKRMVSSPVISVVEYDMICLELPVPTPERLALRSSQTRNAVALYLHNVGEIIFFRNHRFMIINPRWLGVGILGNLLDVFGRTSTSSFRGVMGYFQSRGTSSAAAASEKIFLENGFVNLGGLRTILKESQSLQPETVSTGLDSDHLIEILSALEICYKDDVRDGYLIPSALDDREELASRGLRALKWHTIPGAPTHNVKCIGRRLQCDNQDLTVLTPGFFPRLQVVLRKHLVEQKIVGEQGYSALEVDRNLLRFHHNTMDVIVEYAEGDQYRGNFVDVLVRTLRDHSSTVDFIDKHILNVIRKFCAQPEGNQGVILVEGIIRPRSVEHLVLCKYRENQAVLISHLEEHLKHDMLYQFCWNAVPNYADRPASLGVPEYAYALDAVKGEGFAQEFKRKQISDVLAKSRGLNPLKEPMKTELENLNSEQVLPHTPKLVYILEKKMDHLPVMSQSEVKMRLHLECEWKDGPHAVPDQPGRSFVVDEEVRKALTPMLQWAYKLCKLGGIAVAKTVPFFGALEVGVGLLPERIPTLPPAFFDQRTMEKMGRGERHQMVRYYEEILKESPSCEWLSNFLDLQGNLGKFEVDFKLKKVRYKDTKEIGFLCEDCRISGFTSNILQLP